MVKHFKNDDWNNAYEAVKLPDALSGIWQAIQTAFGRDVRPVAPTAAKFSKFSNFNRINVARENLLIIGADTSFVNLA